MKKNIIKNKLDKILDELDTLRMEIEETAESIEPHKGKDDLTDEQQEKQEWCENLASTIEDAIDNIRSEMD